MIINSAKMLMVGDTIKRPNRSRILRVSMIEQNTNWCWLSVVPSDPFKNNLCVELEPFNYTRESFIIVNKRKL